MVCSIAQRDGIVRRGTTFPNLLSIAIGVRLTVDDAGLGPRSLREGGGLYGHELENFCAGRVVN